MHIFEEASPTIIGQMVTPKNIGDFFLESSYYFYCWDDLMELEYGQCVRNKKKYYFISEFAEAIMKRGFFCDKPLYAEFTEEQIQKYFSGEYSVGQIFALAISQALNFTPEQVRFLYKGIIINHNKKPSQPTLKRRFFKKKAAFFHGPVWERSGADFILKRKGEFF